MFLRFAILTCLLILAIDTNADIKNRNLLPLGEREALRGNTGTASAGSAGAVYYNPAGLASIKKGQISLSGSTYLYFDSSTDKFLYASTDNQYLGYRESGFSSTPSALVSVFGSGDWTLALSLLSPGTASLRNKRVWQIPSAKITISRMTESSEFWAGISAARELNERWMIGLSLFGTRVASATTTHSETTATAVPNFIQTQHLFAQSGIYSLSAILGVLYKASPIWHLGLRLHTPWWQISGKTDYLATIRTVSGGVLTSNETERDQVDTNGQVPMDLALGISLWPERKFRLLFDISHQSAISYEVLPNTPNTQRANYGAMMRYNLGFEQVFSENLMMAWGFSYNPSAVTVVDVNEGGNKDDFYGITVGLQYSTTHTRFGGGAYYLTSNGERITLGSLEKSPSQTRVLGVVLTTGYQF